jgi:hypothetical protein
MSAERSLSARSTLTRVQMTPARPADVALSAVAETRSD